MIQRIQSLFLLISSASFWTLLGLPFASSEEPTDAFLADQLYNYQDNIIILILVILGGALALLTIFLYKNRLLQRRLSYLVLIVGILLPFVVIFLFYNEATQHYLNTQINDGAGIYIPLITIVSTVLAIRYIKKDEKVVKSMDRLR